MRKKLLVSFVLTMLLFVLVSPIGVSIGVVDFDGGYALASGIYLWHTQTVDSSGDMGRYTSIALDSGGNPHISYMASDLDLKYAYYDGTWHIETVDSSGAVGEYSSLALDSGGNPHISYYDMVNDVLKYAYYNGTDWNIETVDDGGYFTSIALDSGGNPHISYRWIGSNTLRYAYYDGTNWHFKSVDSGGHYTSLALDSGGNPHISYVGTSGLKYAYYDGAWHTQTVDSGNVSKIRRNQTKRISILNHKFPFFYV